MVACASSGSGSSDGTSGEQRRSLSEPIIGGHLDTTTKGVVALAFKAHSQVAVFCSGSLLAPNLVLTARHCIAQIGDGTSEQVDCASTNFTAKYDPRQIFVSTDSTPDSTSQFFGVKEIREAPGGTKVCGFDVALLILSSNVPVSIATPIEPVLDDPTLAKAPFSAVGYGLQDPNDKAGTTAGTRQRFDSSSVYCVGASCPTAAGTEADEFVGNSPVCSGDSGGPALDAEGRVFGVTSRGDSACTYALYSNVASWASFVRSTELDAAAAGGYAPPTWASTGGSVSPGFGGASSAGAANAGGSGGEAATPSSAGNGGTTPGTVPPTQPVTPTVDPLGAVCGTSNDCPGTYQCFSATAKPPGECVPPCSAATPNCPKDYTCSLGYGVCTPGSQGAAGAAGVGGTVETKHISSSCSLANAPQSGSNASFALALGLGAVWLGRRRRPAG